MGQCRKYLNILKIDHCKFYQHKKKRYYPVLTCTDGAFNCLLPLLDELVMIF